MITTPRLLTVLALLALGVLGWLAFNSNHKNDGSHISLYGEVEIRQADLGFDVEGPIEAVLVDEGDRVKQGQELGRLDQIPYRIAVHDAEASLKNAQELLRQYRNGFRPQEIEESRANLAAAEANLRNAELNDQRNQELIGRKFVSQAETDLARAQLDVAKANLRQARADLSLKLEGTREETIAQAEASVAALSANLDLQRYRYDRTILKAPNDGIVLTRIKEPGAIVAANSPVLTISVIDPVWIRAYVDEPHLDWLPPGTKVTVTTDAVPARSYAGHVGYVSPTAEFTPKTVATPELRTSLVYRVRIVVDNPDASLRQGMPATVVVSREAAGGAKK